MTWASAPGSPGEQLLRGAPRASRRARRSQMSPYLMTSARPARSSRAGSVLSVLVSASPPGRLVEGADEVLAARVVDARSCRRRPSPPAQAGWSAPARRQHRAGSWPPTNPARSPTTPPPRATTAQSRAKRLATSTSSTRATLARRLVGLPIRQDHLDATAARRGRSASARRYSGATVVLLTMSTSRAWRCCEHLGAGDAAPHR